MNYELALKLKEAGFPQKIKQGDGFFYNHDKNNMYYSIVKFNNTKGKYPWIKAPSISELIEEFLDHAKFELIYVKNLQNWKATVVDSEKKVSYSTNAEIAVANLWLQLNASQR